MLACRVFTSVESLAQWYPDVGSWHTNPAKDFLKELRLALSARIKIVQMLRSTGKVW